MADDLLVVNFQSLHHASQSIQTALNMLDGRLREIDGEARKLVATWEGDAQSAYYVRQKAWESAAGNLAAILNEIKRAVDDSAARYLQTEKDNTQLFPSGR